MFTQPCFIRKNTPELRQKLEELGYKRSYYNHDNHVWLIVNQNNRLQGQYSGLPTDYDPEYCMGGDYINCCTNEQLFLALAALRDDSTVTVEEIIEKYGN